MTDWEFLRARQGDVWILPNGDRVDWVGDFPPDCHVAEGLTINGEHPVPLEPTDEFLNTEGWPCRPTKYPRASVTVFRDGYLIQPGDHADFDLSHMPVPKHIDHKPRRTVWQTIRKFFGREQEGTTE